MTSASAPKVLLVGSALGGGGAENRLRLLLARLFCGTADAATLHGGEADDPSPRQTLHTLGWQRKADYPKAIIRLRGLLSSGRYDAALSLGLYPNVVLWAASRRLSNRPALIMTEITRPYTESTRFSGPISGRLRQPLYRVSYGGADLVAANSEGGLQEIVAHYGVAADKITRIPNLIDVARVRALVRSAEAATPPRFCMVARFDPIKRFDTLLRAAQALDREMDWHIDLVGDGAARPVIEALVNELGLRGRVTLHGWAANPYPIMAAASATILCSEYEGFSNTVLESMIIGTPVITSFCSIDARTMVEERTALGFEIGDWQALARHLEALMREPGLASALRLRAERYAARHHVDIAISEYEALVQDAIACHSRRMGRGH